MEYSKEKVDDMVLALLHLTTFSDTDGNRRSWKNHDWDVMDRLHEKGFIGNPKSKNRSVSVSEEGRRRSEDMFRRYCV
jgi:hypothetical protein